MLATFLKTYLNLKVLQPNGDKPLKFPLAENNSDFLK